MLADKVRSVVRVLTVFSGCVVAAFAVARGLRSERGGTVLTAIVSLPVAYALAIFIVEFVRASNRLEDRVRTHEFRLDNLEDILERREKTVKLRTVSVERDDETPPGSAA